MRMTPISPNPFIMPVKQAPPRFGVASAPMLLKALDFANLGTSTVGQNKLIYGLVIGSRVGYSRSANERWENIRRDALGWYSWFMGSPLLQVGIVTGMLPLIAKGSKELMVRKLNQNASLPQKLMYTLFNPSKLWLLASDKQLEQRQEQIVEFMRRRGKALKSTDIGKIEKLFTKTKMFRGMTSLIGMLFTIALLGVGINLINIALTKASLVKSSGNPPRH